jgi:hypothetical protein
LTYRPENVIIGNTSISYNNNGKSLTEITQNGDEPISENVIIGNTSISYNNNEKWQTEITQNGDEPISFSVASHSMVGVPHQACC